MREAVPGAVERARVLCAWFAVSSFAPPSSSDASFSRIERPKEPTARDVFLAVAALDGCLKHNGESGSITLGRGYEKLRTLTEGWAAPRGLGDRSDV